MHWGWEGVGGGHLGEAQCLCKHSEVVVWLLGMSASLDRAIVCVLTTTVRQQSWGEEQREELFLCKVKCFPHRQQQPEVI